MGAKRKSHPKSVYTQDFIPLKDIRNGIIETTDGRYIKILEIEPINFMLRSSEEQWGIISSFASWLKISPMRMQFKSVTRKADSDKHISMVQQEVDDEPNIQCRELGKNYIRFVKDVGSREALIRRFFLIFQYEPPAGRRIGDQDYADIFGTIQTVAQNARAYFLNCGNSIIQQKDEDLFTAEVLYMYFNRKSCVDEPLNSRIDRVVMDTMAAKGKIVGIDEVPRIRPAHFIAPRGINLYRYNHIVMDGMYYSFLYIKRDGFPGRVRAGWMSALINAGEGVDIDLHLRRENRGRTLDKVAQRIRLNRTKLKSMPFTTQETR